MPLSIRVFSKSFRWKTDGLTLSSPMELSTWPQDKDEIFTEMNRILKPGGRLQIADILVDKPIPESAKRNIDLWTG